jgi:predicted transcriptional regulator
MQYRSRSEIITRILEIVNEGSSFGDEGLSRTKIMYKAFLSHAQLKEYLMILTERDLLRYDVQTRTFKTTEKGLIFLKAYDEIDQLVKEREI